jgi:uncharacterized membrane protein affecting hemolysin expression
MIDKKQNIGFWGMFIIFLIIILFVILLTSGGESQSNQPRQLQTNDAQAQWEKEQNDIAKRKLKNIYEGIDNGLITCKNGVCSQ